ncbi:MAG: hypothetical protein IJU49_08385 [Lachnospiraceae bacterium]|nr:hypothetical protein [Lachnospiraceae bacterium]
MKKTLKLLAWIVSGVLFASSVMACGRQPEQPATEPIDKTTSEAPVTEEPTTEEPETEEPTTEEPTTEEPSTEEPTTEEPVEAVVPEGLTEYHYEGLVFCIPEDFYEYRANSSLVSLVSKDYPSVGDNMTLTKTPGVRDFSKTYSEESLHTIFSTTMQKTYNAEIEDFTYKADRINGLDRVIVRYSVNISGIEMRQITCVFSDGERIVSEAFTLTTGEYTELFEAAIDAVWPEQ